MKIYLLGEQIKFNTLLVSSCEIVDIKLGFLSEFQYLQQFPPHQLSLLSNPFPSFGDGVSVVFFVGIWYIGLRTWYAYAFCIWATTCATSACSSFFLVPQLWCVCYVKVHLVKMLCACGILGWVYGTLWHI